MSRPSFFSRRDTRKVAVVGDLVKNALINADLKESPKSLQMGHKRSDLAAASLMSVEAKGSDHSGDTAPLSSSDDEKEFDDLVLSFSDFSEDSRHESCSLYHEVSKKRGSTRRVTEPTAFDFLQFSDSEDEDDDEPEKLSRAKSVEKIWLASGTENESPLQEQERNSIQAEKGTEESRSMRPGEARQSELRPEEAQMASEIPRSAHHRAKSEVQEVTFVPVQRITTTHRRTKSLGRDITWDMETIHEVDEPEAVPGSRQRASSEAVPTRRKYFNRVPRPSRPAGPSPAPTPSRQEPKKPADRAWLGGQLDGNMLEQDLKGSAVESDKPIVHPLLSSKPPPSPRISAVEKERKMASPQAPSSEKTTIDSILSKSLPSSVPKKNHHRSRSAMPETIVPVAKTSHRRTRSLGREITWDMETIDETNELPRQRTSSEVVAPSKYFDKSPRQSSPKSSEARDSNDLDALRTTLEIRKEQHGPHHPKVGEIHNLIGNIYFRFQQYEQAIEAYKKTLQCDKGAKNPVECAPIAAALGNIGTAYWTLGDISKSLEYLEHALRAHIFLEQSQGKDPKASLVVAGCMYQIGCAECLRKDYKSALQNLTLCCKVQVTVLGESHVDVARTLDAIGKAYLGLGDYERAMDNHQEALLMKRRCGSGDSATSGIFVSLRNIAAVRMARNEFDEAIALYLEVSGVQKSQLAKLKREPGYNKPAAVRLATEAGETLVTLKELYEMKGDNENAIKKGREAALYFKEGGVDDNDTRISSCLARGSRIWSSI